MEPFLKAQLEQLQLQKADKAYLIQKLKEHEVKVKEEVAELKRAIGKHIQDLTQNGEVLKEIRNLTVRLEILESFIQKKESDVEDMVAARLVTLIKHYEKGRLYDEAGQFDLAIAEFNKTLGLNPYEKDCHYNLGFLYYKIRKPHLAVQHWERYLELDPTGEGGQELREHIQKIKKEHPELRKGGL